MFVISRLRVADGQKDNASAKHSRSKSWKLTVESVVGCCNRFDGLRNLLVAAL
jgi:hypothetical protein